VSGFELARILLKLLDMKASFALFSALGLVFVALPAHAKELYVDQATGNDDTTYAENDAAHPFATIQRAVWGSLDRDNAVPNEAAQPGDTVHVLAGTYIAAGTGERWYPAFLPINTGTQQNPIVIQAEGEVRLEHDCGTQCNDDQRSPLIGGCCNIDWITWRGFILDEANASYHADTGLVGAFGSTGIVFENLEIIGGPAHAVDNHNGIRFEDAQDCVARNNRIHGIHSVDDLPAHHNQAGIMLYGNTNILIEHNEIWDTGAAIFPKGNDNSNITIRYNLLHGNLKGIRNTFSHPTNGDNRAYQNVIFDCVEGGIGIQIAEHSYHWTIANNTIHGCSLGISQSGSDPVNSAKGDLIYQNNIITNASDEGFNCGDWSEPIFPLDYSAYHQVDQWSYALQAYNTFASWQAASGQDAHSFLADPMFVNAAAGDFHLSSGSPAEGTGVDLLDLDGDGQTNDPVNIGAYVTGTEVIGVTDGSAGSGGSGGTGGTSSGGTSSGGSGNGSGSGGAGNGTSSGGSGNGSSSGGNAGANASPDAGDDDGGCGCRLAVSNGSPGAWLMALGGLLLLRRRRTV
jgi:hypothetical protein